MEYEIVEFQGLVFRVVKAYEYEFNTYCKERWRHRSLLDVFASDFRAYAPGYLASAIESGRILVNSQSVGPDYILKGGDKITHKTVRCEPPVLFAPIAVLYDHPDILVVDKPASLPVHESGSYRKNTLSAILAVEHGYQHLKQIHRLDRVTSGIVIFAKTSQVARSLSELIKQKETEKWYLARVQGHFPQEEVDIRVGLSCVSAREGIQAADPEGKDSRTLVYLKHYDPQSDQSVVWCRPITGRTHQIRVHLQYVGHPIANDTCYGGQLLHPVETPDIHTPEDLQNFGVDRDRMKQMMIWLHAYKYKLREDLVFTSPMPDWASN